MAVENIDMSENFGFKPDENGDINFMTVSTEHPIHNFEEYMEFFEAFVQLAEDNPGIMPILTFNDESGS